MRETGSWDLGAGRIPDTPCSSLLYLGFLASGFFDRTVMYVLAAVLAAQAGLLLVFRLALGRVM